MPHGLPVARFARVDHTNLGRFLPAEPAYYEANILFRPVILVSGLRDLEEGPCPKRSTAVDLSNPDRIFEGRCSLSPHSGRSRASHKYSRWTTRRSTPGRSANNETWTDRREDRSGG